MKLGRFDEACAKLERTVSARAEFLGHSSSDTLSSIEELGNTYFELSRVREALAKYTELKNAYAKKGRIDRIEEIDGQIQRCEGVLMAQQLKACYASTAVVIIGVIIGCTM